MSIYLSQYPSSITIDPLYKAFFEEFYTVSDTPDAHDQYVSYFKNDATLIMGSKSATDKEGILGIRHGLWSAVKSRRHNPIKVFPFGDDSSEVMLYGTVDYILKTGEAQSKDWAARANLVKEDGKVRFGFYQVYLDTAAPAK